MLIAVTASLFNLCDVFGLDFIIKLHKMCSWAFMSGYPCRLLSFIKFLACLLPFLTSLFGQVTMNTASWVPRLFLMLLSAYPKV
jgi:hypothetical protein